MPARTWRSLQNIIRQGGNIGAAVAGGVKEAVAWFRNEIKKLRNVDGNEIMAANPERHLRGNKLGKKDLGKMLMFYYDPKWKHKLPYYDRFPLIIPIPHNKGPKYFMGLNLHYLSPYQREKFFASLYRQTGRNLARTKYAGGITPDIILKGSVSLAASKPSLKLYLYPHVRSRFQVVPPEEYFFAIHLPPARFGRGGKGGGVLSSDISNTEVCKASRKKF